MDRRRAAGVLLALAACVAYATAAPTASNHTSLDVYDGAPDGCYYNFQHYGEGDRIMTNEPCLNCTCHNRMLMCYLRVCPFTKPIGQDCTIEKRADQCCPIVTCPDVPVDLLTSTTTSPAEYGATGLGKLDKYGCSIHGKYFPEGSKVPPTPNKPCEHCYCIRNMTTCVMQECTLHVDGCTPIYHKDVCCPVRYSCDHPEDEMPLLDDLSTTVRPTPGFLLTTTPISPVTQMSQDCLYENQVIRDGALIKTEKACDHCYCMKGDIVCVVQECGTPMENEGKNCTALAPREGVCCPDTYICEGDEPTTGTYEMDYTTELEKLATLTPPRRSESEGSGYRKETDDVPDTEILPTETETEGSGYDQATIFPTVLTETPDSHKIESSDELMPSTTIKELDSHDVTTESELQKDIESHDISSTTSTYISQPIFESLSTKAQDEDIGSGEEDIISPFTEAPSAPTAADHEPTVSSEQNAFTLDDSQVTDSETHVQGTTAGTLTGDENQTEVPKEPSVSSYDNTMDITTHDALGGDEEVETSTFDDEYKFTENDNLRTTAIPAVEENEKETTSSSQAQDKETSDAHHYVTPPTNVPGIEDNLSTTELQETATDSFEETVSEIYDHHPLTATSSTPLLEEIEKDTMDQEAIRDESTSDAGKISTIGLNVPTEESIDKDNLIPDLIDETIATNIPTTVSTIDEDSVTTEDEHTNKESDYEYSSEPQQHSSTTITSISRDGTESTSSIDPITTSKAQETEASESFDHPHDISATVPDVDKTKETTSSDDVTTSKFDEDLETNAEHTSEPQYSPTTSGPRYDGESKETTQIPITVVKESSESQESDSTTSAAILDDETKLSSSDKTQEGQDNVEDSSESQHYEPTTIKPLVDVQTIETTSIKPMDDDLIKDVSESQENVPTTNASMLEDETKVSTPIVSDSDNMESSKSTIAPVFEVEDSKPTPSDGLTTSEAQDVQKADTDDSSESNENVPVTSVPAFEDDLKKTTLSDYVSTSKDQKSDVVDSSESNQYAPTTIGIVSEDESKLTTQSDLTTASNIQDMEKTQEYIPTTSASSLKDESKYTTSLGFEKSSTPVASEFEDKTEETISITTAKQNEITTIEPDKGLNTIPSGSIEEEITESPEVEQSHAVEVVPTETDTDAGKLHDVTESAVDTADLSTQDSSTSSNDLLPKSTESAVKEIDDSSTKVYDVTENIIRVTDLTNEEISTLTYNQESSTKHPVTEYLDRSTSTLSSNTESDTEKPIDTSYEHSPEITSSQSSEESQPATSSPYSDSVTVSTASDMKENEISNESRIPGEGDCLLNGITYRNESAVPSTNKCQSGCRCSSSIIKCDPIICSPPPEYMDNCQTTYDSPDSCCPTFVCDHKTETMPPQSHSQMSGTEAPVESPIKCIGDECILTEHKKEPSTTSNCDSDNCSVQDTQIANVPAEDQNKECSGSLCKTGANECSLENGCEATPVKPCEGLECDDSSQTILPPKQEPCSGDNCDDENELNIEKECTDKSCKRKDNSELDEKPPKKCLGSECPLIDTSPVETEKIEDSSKASSTETNIDINHEVEEHVTEADLELKTTIAISDESTKLSEQGTKKDEISTSYELTTPSHKESFEPELTTKDYESQHDYSTDKVVYDVTSEAAELQTNIPDLSVDDKSTVADAADVTTTSPKTYTDQEQDNFTKVPLESDGKDVTTLSQEQQITQVTQLPEKYVPEDVSETTSIIQEVENDAMSTLAPGSSDTISYDGTTKFSVDTNEEDTDSTDNVTKSPHISEESTTKYSEAVDTTSKLDDTDLQDSIATEDSTTKIADVIDSKTTTPKLTDLQETTEVTNDSYNEETSLKSTDVFESQSDVSTTTVSSRSSTEIIAETSKFDDLEKTHDITVTTQPEATTISTIEDEKTEASKSSEADVSVVTESLEETYSEETTTEQEIKSPTSKPYDVQSQETTMPSEKTEDLEITKIPSVTEPSSVSTTDTITKSPVTVEFTISDGSSPTFETEPSKVAVTDSSGLEITSTTKPLVTDSETQYTTADTDMEPNKSDETVTHLTEPISTLEPSLDVATIQSLDDDHKLYTESNIQENTTPEQSILSELTTQTVLVPDSNIIETEGPDDDKEIITRIQDQTESITESATESIDRTTSSSVESSPVKEDDLTSILPHQVTTESPLDFTISSESHSEVTASSDKPSEFDETTPTKINNIPQTVTELPIEEEPEKETMKTIIKDVTDEAQTQVSELEKTEKDTTTEQAIYEPSETTDNIDKKPEQIQPIDTHEEQPAEPSRVAAIPDVFATKQPDDSEIEKETQTEKPGVQENYLNSETTLSNEITDTYDEKITESPMKEEEKQETTQYHEIKPTESLTEMYTETPLAVSSDREDQTIDDEKLTTVSVKIPEPTTESADMLTNAPSEPSPLNEDLEITPKEPVDTKVTLQEETTSETEKLQGEEIQTTVSDLPIEQESTTKEQQSNDIPKLTTESPKYTDYSEESTTTEKHLSSETVTEVVGTTKVVDETTSEKEYEPSASATTASEEQITEKQGDSDTVTTEKILTTDFMISETTKLSSAFETSTHITTGPVEEAITTMTSLHELSESTTSKVDDEVVHAQKESTESPTTVEPMLAPTATKQDEVENLIPSKTERPEIYATTLSETEEPIKSTPSIREGGSTGSDQSDTSESDSSDDNRLTTNPAFDVETHSTIKTPAIEDETEKAITPSESSIQPEPSSVATVLEDEKPTTEVEKQTTTKVEPTTAYPVFDKFTKTTQKPTDAPATEQPKPIPTEEQVPDDALPTDEEPPSSGPSGYGTDPDYMEEDQTFGPGTCRYGGKVYVSAQQIPRDDPCDFCFCFRSDIICLQQSCPPPIHGCHEEPISGFCCPRYECPVSMATTVNVTTTTTTTTTTLPPHFPVHSYKGSAQKRGCLIKGHTYKVGEVVRASSGPCLHCTCGGDGQMKCDPKQCTPEPMLRQMIAAAVSAKRRR